MEGTAAVFVFVIISSGGGIVYLLTDAILTLTHCQTLPFDFRPMLQAIRHSLVYNLRYKVPWNTGTLEDMAIRQSGLYYLDMNKRGKGGRQK
ncbi:hypothetical protein OUZ56_024847 [Daphnia magna]|uniref:Uncharacterized protein n=1 Tax=Daphnia magna TaxID=35525 RepID=A0ABQ9ZI57_9CRUS|nr:hypothetical protein OUZ56_024847 [Daphnia magna]